MTVFDAPDPAAVGLVGLFPSPPLEGCGAGACIGTGAGAVAGTGVGAGTGESVAAAAFIPGAWALIDMVGTGEDDAGCVIALVRDGV